MKNTKDFTDTKIFKCPRCGKLISFEENPYKPFCSKRCKMVDLGSWFKEKYQISTPMESEEQ
ncbi:MAG: DNA gyrase inhibitor YacG [Thermodesulfobacteriota bacterium]|nr:MAG: DNA gyrase inhibitor YacG [Thermodesulfobacteriota bacterium]